MKPSLSDCFMMKTVITYTLLLCCIFSTNTIFSQTAYLDSLIYQALPKAKEDTSKVNLLNEISWRYHRMDYDKTMEYAEKALTLAQQLSFDKGAGLANNYLGLAYSLKGNREKAIALNEECLRIGELIDSDYLMSTAYNDLGVAYLEKGEHETALRYLQMGLDISLESNDAEGIGYGYMNIGMAHLNVGSVKEAILFFDKSLPYCESSDDPMMMTIACQNKAEVYYGAGDLDSAIISLDMAYEIAEKNKDFLTMTDVGIVKSYFYLDEGYGELAEMSAYESINAAGMSKTISGEIYSYLALTEIQLSLNKLDAAEKSILVAQKLAEENAERQTDMDIDYLLYKVYNELGDFEKALAYHVEFSHLQDSMFSIERINKIAELNEKYQLDKQIDENNNLILKQKNDEANLKKRRTIIYSLLIISVLFGIVGILIYRLYRLKDSSHKLLEKKIEERTKELLVANNNLKNSNMELERFAYIASHDLKEPLRNISSFAKLLDKSLSGKLDARETEFMNFISKNTSRMEELIEDVLEYSKISTHETIEENIALDKVIKHIEYSIGNTLKKKDSQIIIKDPLPEIVGHPFRIHLLFKNLIENGIKYNENEHPTVTIEHHANAKEDIYSVSDNGIGIEEEYFPVVFEMFKRLHNRETYEGTGLGLALSQKIVSELDGRIEIESKVGEGSTFHIYLPKRKMAA